MYLTLGNNLPFSKIGREDPIQRTDGTALLVISHDLNVVRYLADRVVVMYRGQVMERGTVAEVFAPPYHPYTEVLLAAIPQADPTRSGPRSVVP